MSGEETDPPPKAGPPNAEGEAAGDGVKDGQDAAPPQQPGGGKRTAPAAAALRQSLRKPQAPPDGAPPRKSRPTSEARRLAKPTQPAQTPAPSQGEAGAPKAGRKATAKAAGVPAKVPAKSAAKTGAKSGAGQAKLPARARPAPVRDTSKAVAVRAQEVADPQLSAVSAAAPARKTAQASLHSMTSQEDPLASKRNTDPDPLGFAIDVILRVAAVVWLAGAVLLWGRLVGYIETDLSPAWHDPTGPWVSTGAAAVAWPAVAVGLWLTARWGVVLWGAALAIEFAIILTDASLAPFGLPAFYANLAAFAVVTALGGVRAVRRKEYN
ncbi:MAG: hypothetical protein AAGD34_17640 [Pseudomonadota bacterium]